MRPCADEASADDLNGADTAWILTSTALVLFMTIPGLSLFYAGLVRVKNVLSVLMQCFALTCLMSVVWFVVGYTIAFGSDGVEQGPYIGDFGNMFFASITMERAFWVPGHVAVAAGTIALHVGISIIYTKAEGD